MKFTVVIIEIKQMLTKTMRPFIADEWVHLALGKFNKLW